MQECVARGGRMAAWRVHSYGGAAALRLDDARVPALRAPGQLLVRVHAAALNPLDLAMTEGYGVRVLNALRALSGAGGGGGGGGVELPLVVGRELVGVVERAGGAARLRRGQRVWAALPPHAPGCLARLALLDHRWAGPAPTSLGLEAGGALYAALTARAALRAAGVVGAAGAAPRRRPRVLLLGLGGVGHAALQLLVYEGAQVVVGCSADEQAVACAAGAAAALDRRASDYHQQQREAGPYEAVLDCAGLGGDEAAALAARGCSFRRYVTLTTPLLHATDRRGLAAAAGAAPLGCPPPHVRWAFFSASADDIELLRRLAERGQFSVRVERVFPWWQLPAAARRAQQGSARGKLLLDFRAEPPPAAAAAAAAAAPDADTAHH